MGVIGRLGGGRFGHTAITAHDYLPVETNNTLGGNLGIQNTCRQHCQKTPNSMYSQYVLLLLICTFGVIVIPVGVDGAALNHTTKVIFFE